MVQDDEGTNHMSHCQRHWRLLLVSLLVIPAIVFNHGTNALPADEVAEVTQVLPVETIDAAIVANLSSRLKEHMASSIIGLGDRTILEAFVPGPSDRRLTLKLEDGDCEVLYTGRCATHFNRGILDVPPPQPGAMLRPMREIHVAETRIRAEELLLRTERGWEARSTDQIIDVLRAALTATVPVGGDENAMKEARTVRAIGAAGSSLLGKDAAPLTDELLVLLKEKQLDNDEVVAACQALGNIGGPEVTKALVKLRSRVRDHASMEIALNNALKQIRKSSSAAPRTATRRSETDPEKIASTKLQAAKAVLTTNKTAGRRRLDEIVRDYEGTTAAKEAEDLLKKQ